MNCRGCMERTFGTEYFIYCFDDEDVERKWDKDAAWDLVQSSHLTPHDFIIGSDSTGRDDEFSEEHLPHIDMQKPAVILVDERTDESLIFDGIHRIECARREGRTTFPAYFVTMDFLEPCRLPSSVGFVN